MRKRKDMTLETIKYIFGWLESGEYDLDEIGQMPIDIAFEKFKTYMILTRPFTDVTWWIRDNLEMVMFGVHLAGVYLAITEDLEEIELPGVTLTKIN